MNKQTQQLLDEMEARIEDIMQKLEVEQVGSQDYERLTKLLADMTNIRNGFKSAPSGDGPVEKKRWFEPIKGDTIVGGVISLASILLILKYEKFDIITTKAFTIATRLIGR